MKFKVYLAGPIEGESYEGATGWRDEAAGVLRERSRSLVQGYSPMRSKGYLSAETTVGFRADGSPASYTQALSTSKGITCRDSFDVRTSDVVLVNALPLPHASTGTTLEIGMAYALAKPVVLVAEPDHPLALHPMSSEMCQFIVPTLEEGLDTVLALLLP